MRHLESSVLCLGLLACTPATDLQSVQAANGSTENTKGQLTSPEIEALAGQLVEPPAGAVAIPTNLAGIIVRFTEDVWPAGLDAPFLLRPAVGDPVPVLLGEAVACDGKCYQLHPGVALVASTLHTLEAVANGLQFFDGKPVPGGSMGAFTTAGEADTYLPRLEAFTVQTAEGCLSVHMAADEVVRAEVLVTAGDSQVVIAADVFAKTLDYSKRMPELPIVGPAEAALRLVDRAGNFTVSAPVVLDLPASLPRLVVTEVLANPAGSETTQEMVEIYNAGYEPVVLTGLRLADKSGSDTLPEATLAPGAFAVVVAESYDPTDGKDPAPRDNTLIVRVPGRLGSDGLSNTGELVQLLTSSGYIVSQYGGWVDVSASAWSGKSVKRVNFEVCDGIDAWSKNPGPSTPGW
jgi:hypothetical protein